MSAGAGTGSGVPEPGWHGVSATSLVANLVPALTIWREASGEGPQGMLAVAWVIRNRMGRRALTANAVCLQSWQFSSMTAKGDPGMSRFPDFRDASFQEAFTAWIDALDMKVADPTLGADYYFNPSEVLPPWAAAYTHTVSIGRHDFYRSQPGTRVSA